MLTLPLALISAVVSMRRPQMVKCTSCIETFTLRSASRMRKTSSRKALVTFPVSPPEIVAFGRSCSETRPVTCPVGISPAATSS